ncbi:MAG TPA: hypothetical protein VFE33_27840 [Thermoanaerobaculia bacterium]|nr:hypothetical protein [Thermoanaerobaculia bacterium]
MKRRVATIAMAVLLLTLPFITPASAAGPGMKGERAMHPRIAKAIHSLQDAVEYMQKAPHDFGGHKADAIAASEKAIEQLKLALAYRAGADH